MAGANKRTSTILGGLVVLFLVIIIIICVVPNTTTTGPGEHSKSLQRQGVLTDTTTTTSPPTTTTTTTTTPPTTTTTTITTTTPTTTTTSTSPPTTTTTSPPTTTTTSPPTTKTTTPTSSTTSSTTTYTTNPTIEDTDTPTTTSTTPTTTSTTATTTSTTNMPTTTSTIVTTTGTTDEPTSTTTDGATAYAPSRPATTTTTTTASDTSTITTTTTDSTTSSASTTDTITTSTLQPPPLTTTVSSTLTTSTTSTTTEEEAFTSTLMQDQLTVAPDQAVCETTTCKSLAARMLDMMDHSGVDPCEDFYQYSCGGVVDDLFLSPENIQAVTRDKLTRLLDEVDAESSQVGDMKVFYESCLKTSYQGNNWLAPIKKIFLDADLMLMPISQSSNFFFIKVMANLMKLDFAPFFDLLVDVGDNDPGFVLKLTPPDLRSPSSADRVKTVCLQEHDVKIKELGPNFDPLNVTSAYEDFITCMNEGEGLDARLVRMEEAVKKFKLMDRENQTSRSIELTLRNARSLLETLSKIVPNERELKDTLNSRVYEEKTLEEVDNEIRHLNFYMNFTELASDLLSIDVKSSTTIQLYFWDKVKELLNQLNSWDLDDLQNVLVVLLGEKLYTDLIMPMDTPVGHPRYCFDATISLMEDFTSYLYMDSLTNQDYQSLEMVKEMVKKIKEAAKIVMKNDTDIDHQLNYMELKIPEKVDIRTPTKLNLTDNFWENCHILTKRRRSLMYQQYEKVADIAEVMWSKFLLPFSPSGIYLYPMNSFLIPPATLEAPFYIKDAPNYINYAGIGHMIANLIMHGFDQIGLKYAEKNSQGRIDVHDEFRNKADCLNNGTGLNDDILGYQLNEILADSGAARVALEGLHVKESESHSNTMSAVSGRSKPSRRRRSQAEERSSGGIDQDLPLPWLGLSRRQLYFLRLAQNQCSAKSDISMLSLMEGKHLPPKMRVNLIMGNEPTFLEAFKCPLKKQCPYYLLQDD